MKSRSNLFVVRSSFSNVLEATLSALLIGATVHAAPLTWDITPGTVTAGNSVIDDGAGTWDTIAANGVWTSDAGANNIAWTDGNDAIFGGGTGAAGAVTVGTVSATNLTFNAPGSGNYILQGGTLTLTGTPTITMNEDASISSVIAGTAGFTTSGAGKLTLSGANTYSGDTVINAGTLEVQNRGAGSAYYKVGTAGTLLFGYNVPQSYDAGVTVNGAGASATTGLYLQLGRNITFENAGGLTLATAATTIRTYGTGANTILSGYDSNRILLTVNAAASGSAFVSTIDLTGGSYGYIMDIAAGANTATGDMTINGLLTGGGLFAQKGAGSLYLTGASTNNGTFDVRAGSVVLTGGNDRLGSASKVNLGSGAVSGKLVLDGISQTLTNLTTTGTGTTNAVVGNNATLSNLTINYTGTGQAFSGNIGGGGTNENNLGFTKAGTGTYILSGTNTYTGSTKVNQGTLQFAKQGSLYNGVDTNWTAANINVASAATLALNVDTAGTNGFTSANIDTLLTNISVTSSSTTGLQSGAIIGFDTTTATGGTFTHGTVIANSTGPNGGPLGLTKLGTGTLTLSGANSYTGVTSVAAGTLEIQANAAGVGRAVVVSSGATYNAGAATNAGGSFGEGNSITVNGVSTADPSGLYLKGGLKFQLGSTLKLQTAPSTVRGYGGTATLTGGNVNDTHLSVLNTASGSVLDSAINIDASSYGYRIVVASGANNTTGDLTVNGIISASRGGNDNGGKITDIGATYTTNIYKDGIGSLFLTGANTFAKGIYINQGSVILSGGNDRLLATSGVILNGTSSLVLNGINQTLGRIASNGGSNGAVVGGSTTLSTLTLNVASDSNTFSGKLGGAGTNQNNLALTKTGTGTQILSGANTYTGATTVSTGTLLIGSGGSLANTAVTVGGHDSSSNPTLAGIGTVGGTTIIASAGTGVVGTHSVGVSGVGTQTFSSSLAYQTGSIFQWDLNAISNGDPGVVSNSATGTYDKVVANGASGSVTGTDAVFAIVLGGNSFSDAFWNTSKSWNDVYSGTGAPADLGSIFTNFTANNSALINGVVPGEGQFTFTGSALNWSAVPEPTSALAGLLLAAGLLRRRR